MGCCVMNRCVVRRLVRDRTASGRSFAVPFVTEDVGPVSRYFTPHCVGSSGMT